MAQAESPVTSLDEVTIGETVTFWYKSGTGGYEKFEGKVSDTDTHPQPHVTIEFGETTPAIVSLGQIESDTRP